MSDPLPLYRCDYDRCALGGVHNPGYFTGGPSAEAVNLLTAQPVEEMVEGQDYGEGVCPNCGSKGTREGVHEYVGGGDVSG